MSFNEKLSYTEHSVVSPTSDFTIGFEDYALTTKDRINVTVDDVDAKDAGYTITRKNNLVVTLTPPVERGVVRLQRETNIDVPFHRFTAGAKFVAANVDQNFTQILHSQQEVRNLFGFTQDYIQRTLDNFDLRIQGVESVVIDLRKDYNDLDERLKQEVIARKGGDVALKLYIDSCINGITGENFLPIQDTFVNTLYGTQEVVNSRTTLTVNTLADLADEPLIHGRSVRVLSYNTPNYALNTPYLGGGVFIYDSNKATVNDAGLVVNGWVRQFDGDCVFLEWFGAKTRDYNSDSVALVNAAATGYSIKLANTFYYVRTPVTFWNRGQSVFGCGAMSGFQLSTGTENFFTFTKVAESGTVLSGGGMYDLRIEAGNRTGGYVLDIFKSNQQVFERVIIVNPYNGITFKKVNNLTFQNFSCAGVRGARGLYADGRTWRSDLLRLNHFNVSGSSSLFENGKASENSPVGIYLQGNIHTVQGNTVLSLGVRHAFVSDKVTASATTNDVTEGSVYKPSFIRVRNLESDFPYARSVYLAAASDTTFSDSYLHGSLTDCGVFIESDCINTTLLNCRVTSHAKQGILVNGFNTKIIGGDYCFNSSKYTNTYAAIDVKEKADGVWCSSVNTNKYYTSNTVYQKYGLLINTGAKNVQFIGGALAGVTAEWLDTSGIDTKRNVIVKGYQGDQADTDSLYTAVVPSNGGSLELTNRVSEYFLNGGGTVGTFTCKLPTAPLDGHKLFISTETPITALTLESADSAVNGLATFAVDARRTVKVLYRKSTNRWFVSF